MATHFDLIITADHTNLTAEFSLLDAHGVQLAFHAADFKDISQSHLQGLFDLRSHQRLYVEPGQEAAQAAEIGVCIAEEVLGQEIFEFLWQSESQRTLRIQLPGAVEQDNPLAAALLPRLFFLSACHSGDILRVKDWADFLAIAQGKEPGAKATDTDTKQLDLQTQPGFTGTAHALMQGGVSSVVAMRYAVGDDYARELAVEFYRALLAHAQPKHAAAALTLARQSMLDEEKHDDARFTVCDHATPVLYGAEQPGLTRIQGRSQSLNPRLHQITELTTATHQHFVGRTWELAGLGSDFIGSTLGAEVRPVAVITGLGGMGKTALVAEALSLW